MGEDDSLWKWLNFRLSRALGLDLGSGHTACHHASLVDLYLHTKFHWNQINICGRTDGGHLRPTLLGRLGEGDLKRNMRKYNKTSCPCGGIARPFVCPRGVTSRFWLARRHTSPLFSPAVGLRLSSINLKIFRVHKMSLVMRMTCRSAVAHSRPTPHQQVALTVSSDMQLALDLMVVPMIRLQK